MCSECSTSSSEGDIRLHYGCGVPKLLRLPPRSVALSINTVKHVGPSRRKHAGGAGCPDQNLYAHSRTRVCTCVIEPEPNSLSRVPRFAQQQTLGLQNRLRALICPTEPWVAQRHQSSVLRYGTRVVLCTAGPNLSQRFLYPRRTENIG